MANILIIDDDKMLCESLSRHFEYSGHESTFALTLEQGIKKVSSKAFDVVFLDVCLPDGNGLQNLPKICENPFQPEIIIITGEGDPDGAELAIQSGAWDYLQKPVSIEDITLSLKRTLQYRQEKKTDKPAVALNRKHIIGDSHQMQTCFDLLAQAASSNTNVLLTGETGTGKELFARAVHENSSRSSKIFVVVDCAALPETLVESVLFGYQKGAFTGADTSRDGLVRQAHGGTLFLDEVGELPIQLQKAFLRVLQEHCFRPVGSQMEIFSDFRLVAATNRNLEEMVQAGQFRSDLLFRLKGLNINLPPLRNHKEDIKDLTIHFLSRFCQRHQISVKGFSPDFFEALTAYNWPGNVRELINTLESTLTSAFHCPTLFARHLPLHTRIQSARAAVKEKSMTGSGKKINNSFYEPSMTLKDFRNASTSEYLENLMFYTNYNIREACLISGVSRSRMYELLKKYNISNTSLNNKQ